MQQQLLKTNGFGLLEVLLTIAVAGIITILSIGYYSNVRNEQKMNEFVNQLVTLSNNISVYIAASASNSAKQDLTTIFGVDGKTNITSNLTHANIVSPNVVMNIWKSGSYYGIYVTFGGALQCTQIAVTAGILPIETQEFCALLLTKLQAALNVNSKDFICAPNQTMEVTYCAFSSR